MQNRRHLAARALIARVCRIGLIAAGVLTAAEMLLAVKAASAAVDEFSYLGQTRSVEAALYGPEGSPTQMFSASNFDEFSQTAMLQSLSKDGYASQEQDSTLGADSINIAGSFYGKQPAFVGNGTATGKSIAVVTFQVAAPTSDLLSASISGVDVGTYGFSDASSFMRFVTLTGPGVQLSWELWSLPGQNSYSQAVTLMPGQYELSSEIDSYNGYGSAVYVAHDYQVSLVPVPAPSSALSSGMMLMLIVGAGRIRRQWVQPA